MKKPSFTKIVREFKVSLAAWLVLLVLMIIAAAFLLAGMLTQNELQSEILWSLFFEILGAGVTFFFIFVLWEAPRVFKEAEKEALMSSKMGCIEDNTDLTLSQTTRILERLEDVGEQLEQVKGQLRQRDTSPKRINHEYFPFFQAVRWLLLTISVGVVGFYYAKWREFEIKKKQ